MIEVTDLDSKTIAYIRVDHITVMRTSKVDKDIVWVHMLGGAVFRVSEKDADRMRAHLLTYA